MIKIIKDVKALRKKSVETIDHQEALRILLKLKFKMREVGDRGYGLCGPQIGIYKRVIYLNYRNKVKLALINPEIIKKSDENAAGEEGCLSLPNTIKNPISVTRPKNIKLKFVDECGNYKVLKFDGIIARVIQHEIDHLNGILIIDYK